MSRFIPSDKLKMLRDAAKNGDSKAKAVLMAQMDFNNDFDTIFNDYFNPVEEEPEIEVINDDSGMEECDIAEELEEPENITVEEPECKCRSIAEQLRKLIADEAEAQKGYSDALIVVANDPELSTDEKTVLITTLKSINDDEMEHTSILLDKLKKYEKKEEKEDIPESIV